MCRQPLGRGPAGGGDGPAAIRQGLAFATHSTEGPNVATRGTGRRRRDVWQPLGHDPIGDATVVARAVTAHTDGVVGLGITAMCLPVIASEVASRRIPIMHLWYAAPERERAIGNGGPL
jgi:hypothetical protein